MNKLNFCKGVLKKIKKGKKNKKIFFYDETL